MGCTYCCINFISKSNYIREAIIKNYAFFPPHHDRYKVVKDEVTGELKFILYQKKKDKSLEVVEIPEIKGIEYTPIFIETPNSTKLASLFIKYTKKKSDYLLIYSHGNSTDLGRMIEVYFDLALNLRINILAYDYSGYGQSAGTYNDINIIKDLQSVYKYAKEQLKFYWNKIILYGQSIGSGPSCFLAADHNYPIAGVILQSPMASGMRVIKVNVERTAYQDFFPNIDLVKYINCPLMIIHGEKDTDIPIIHGQLIVRNCSKPSNTLWMKDAGHNDVDIIDRKTYFSNMYQFIKSIKDINNAMDINDILNKNKASIWIDEYHHIYKNLIVQFDNSNTINNNINCESIKETDKPEKSDLNQQLLKQNLHNSLKQSVVEIEISNSYIDSMIGRSFNKQN